LLLVSHAFATEAETNKHWIDLDMDVRVLINAPANFDANKPTQLLIYLPPNGSTIEMTAGAKLEPGMDWHFDIQHIAAQTRKLRQLDHERNIVLAYIEANARSYKLTWPTWRKEKGDANGALIRVLIDKVSRAFPGPVSSITLASHSGGGSFVFGYLNGDDAIGDNIERIIFIDSNYAYDDEQKHGDKLLAWLREDSKRHLIVFAYNDRVATLNGKPFVSETGGTFYRSHKMIERINRDEKLVQSQSGHFEEHNGMKGQIRFMLHTNPEKKILHTVLVERNGLLEAMTWNTPLYGKWGGDFWGERAYTDLISPRSMNLMGGGAFATSIANLATQEREAAIIAEVSKGNLPAFARKFVEIRVKKDQHELVYQVTPDYFAIGDDADFMRMPLTPAAARKIADSMKCTLPTRKMVNDIYQQATIKLAPKPMTEAREAMITFMQHSRIIEEQRARAGKPLGELVAGHKKDVVISNRLKEKPGKVAIYGWHKPDGKPIQPLYVGHGDFYVDYSHGIRLIKNECVVDGNAMKIVDVLKDPKLCDLISDEGPIDAMY
jgi:hypothetical protein